MADCSLDDYIRRKGIGLNTKRTIGTNPVGLAVTTVAGNLNKGFNKQTLVQPTVRKAPQEFDARRLISRNTRLGGAVQPPVGNVQRSASGTALGVAPRGDARQKILAKTKFGDARERILTKKKPVVGPVSTGFDIRQKLKAKQGFPVQGLASSAPDVFIGQDDEWDSSDPPQNALSGGIMKFGGSLQRTVSNPAAVSSFGASVADQFSVSFQNAHRLPNAANVVTKHANFQPANANQPKQFLSTNSRIPGPPMVDQQPIRTLISQPPVKVVNRTTVSTLGATRPLTTAVKKVDAELVSPLQGFCIKISNLHPNVSQEDIIELFGALGALKRARLVRPGYAEAVFVNYEDAMAAFAKYHMRELDGQPMNLLFDERNQSMAALVSKPSGDQPTHMPLRLNKSASGSVVELEPGLVNKALFEISSDQAPRKHVTFTVRV